MLLKDRLDIVIPTFNRVDSLKTLLNCLLNSPLSECEITIVDNNSSDGTEQFVKDIMTKYNNVVYIKNRYNIGMSGNFVKALTIPKKEYFWVLFDDVKLDFTNWNDILEGLNNDYDCVLTTNYYNLKSVEDKHLIFLMLIFMFAGIYKTELLSDDVISNAIVNAYTLHPQISLIAAMMNDDRKKIYLPKNIVASPQTNPEIVKKQEYSFDRIKSQMFEFRTMKPKHFFTGFLCAIQKLKDKKLKNKIIDSLFDSVNGVPRFIDFNLKYFKHFHYHYVNWFDTFLLLPLKYKKQFLFGTIKYVLYKSLGGYFER